MELTDFYLDKTIIFEKISQERIFEKYLFKPDLSKKYTNPFRVDNNPDCTFYYKNERLYFVDNAWNKKHYDCFNIVMTRFSLGYNAALRKIYNEIDKEVDSKVFTDLKIIDKKSSENTLRVDVRKYLQSELDFWSVFDYKSTEEELQAFGIYAISVIYEQDYIVDGVIENYAYIDNGVLQQIYKSKNKSIFGRRFINTKNFKFGGLSYLTYTTNILVITKSKKDTYFFHILGIESIYIANENLTISEELLNELSKKYTYLFCCFDNDYTGYKCAVRHRKLGINPVFVPEKKDMHEWMQLRGYYAVKEIVDEFKNKFID